jgi:hypothetical protein
MMRNVAFYIVYYCSGEGVKNGADLYRSFTRSTAWDSPLWGLMTESVHLIGC